MVPSFVADKIEMSATGCWLWGQAVSDNGYGVIRRNGRLWKSHCWVYSQMVGPIPTGMDLDHLCRNRSCCNPDHLEPVTRSENLHRGEGAVVSLMCKHGHWKLGDNLFLDPKTQRRFCRTCGRRIKRESARRRRKGAT